MKKLLTILLSVLLLAGCAGNAAKTAVEKAITDYQALLTANLKEAASEVEGAEEEYTLSFMETIYDFTYEIKKVEQNGDAATATVVIKTMNIATFLENYSADEEVVAADNALMEETDETKINEYIGVLTTKLKEYASKTTKDYETELTIPLVKEDGNWSVDPTYDLDSYLSMAIISSMLVVE